MAPRLSYSLASGRVVPIPIQRDLMIATEIIALSHREEYDPFQAITASTMYLLEQ